MRVAIVAKACRSAKSRAQTGLCASLFAGAGMLAMLVPDAHASERPVTSRVLATATVVAPVSVSASLSTPTPRMTESSGWVAVRVVPAAPISANSANPAQGSALMMAAGAGPTIALRVVVQAVQPDTPSVQTLLASGRSGGGTVAAAGELVSGAMITALSLSASPQADAASGRNNYSVTVAFN
jgi:hypothetical protein